MKKLNSRKALLCSNRSNYHLRYFLFILVLSLVLVNSAAYAGIIYVKHDASGTNDGSSWSDAYTDLHAAYSAAVSGDQVWVSAGTYKPSQTGDKSAYFNLKNGVELYGGFDGTETLLQQRQWWKNITIVSGDLNNNDNNTINYQDASRSDNTYNIFYGDHTNNTAVVDGFTVTGGNGNNTGTKRTYHGAAFYFNYGGATVRNCIIIRNAAIATGGIKTFVGSPVISNCVIANNYSGNNGSGVSTYTGSISLDHCTVYNNNMPTNISPRSGISLSYSSNSVTNNIIYGNEGSELSIARDSGLVAYNLIEGGFTGTGNIDGNPLFADAANNNFLLQTGSPAINVGSNDALPVDTKDADYDGNTTEKYPFGLGGYNRYSDGSYNLFTEGTTDIGAYEYAMGKLTVDRLENNQKILTTPTFSWNFPENIFGAQQSYQIQVSSQSDFAATKTIVDPPPVVYMWDSGIVTSTEKTATYNGKELAIGTTYYFRVKVTGASQTSNWLVGDFRTNGLPNYELVFPINSEVVGDTTVTFKVAHTADPNGDDLTFTVYVFSDENLTTLLDSAALLPLSADTVTGSVVISNIEQLYYWRVKVSDGLASVLSSSGVFTFRSKNIDSIFLTGITDPTHILVQTPEINWVHGSPINEQISYRIQVSSVSNFSSIDLWDSGVITSTEKSVVYQGDELIDGLTYYLRIQTEGSMGTSDWKEFSFRMNSVPGPVLTSPVNNVVLSTTPVVLICSNVTDAEGDSLFYKFSAYQQIRGYNGWTGEYSTYIETIKESDWMPAGTDQTSWIINESIEENAMCFWTVQIKDLLETGPVDTAYFGYNAEAEPPEEFELISPEHASVIDTLGITLAWDPATDPDPGDTLNYTITVKYIGENESTWETEPMVFTVDAGTDTFFTFPDPYDFDWDEYTKDTRFLDDHETYYWKVTATDQAGLSVNSFGYSGGWWKAAETDKTSPTAKGSDDDAYRSFMINLEDEVPYEAYLELPKNNSIVTTLKPTFAWEAAYDEDPAAPKGGYKTKSIDYYSLYISLTPDFAETREYYASDDETKYTLDDWDEPLEEDSVYYWKVEAFDDSYLISYDYETGEIKIDSSLSACSEVWQFTVNAQNSEPRPFTLHYPENNMVITYQDAELLWNESIDIDANDEVSYTVIYGTGLDSLMSVDAGDSLSHTFTDSLDDDTRYYWKVVATDLSGATRENTEGFISFVINTKADPPTNFATILPNDTTVVNTLTPTFRWEAAIDTDPAVKSISNYYLHLSLNADMSDSLVFETLETAYTLVIPLLEDRMYYWTVQAEDAGGLSSSDTAVFITNSRNSKPGSLTLITPFYDMESTVRPVFSWTAADDADWHDRLSYALYYGTDVSNLITVDPCDSLYYIPATDLQDDTNYIWRVVVTDLSGATYSSEFHSFRINTANDNPREFSLIGPDSASVCADSKALLVWDISSDLDGNDIQYAIYLNNSNVFPTAIDTVERNYYKTSLLDDGNNYFWKVIAFDELGGSTTSPTWYFDVNFKNQKPAGFALSNPLADQTITTLTPTFKWLPAMDPDIHDFVEYSLFLGSNSENLTKVYSGTDTLYTPENELLDNTVYFWNVLATDRAGAVTVNDDTIRKFVVNLANESPELSVLISPDSVVVLTKDVVLSWSDVIDPDPMDTVHYEVHWYQDVAAMDSLITDTNSCTISNLADNQKYSWYVISMDQHDGISTTQPVPFWMDFIPEAPGNFTTISPANESAGMGAEVEFIWHKSIDPDPFDNVQYEVIYTMDTGDSMQYQSISDLSDTTVSVNMTENGIYYWKVNAVDKDQLVTPCNSNDWSLFTVGNVAIDGGLIIPETFALHSNFPNPFNPTTTISYDIPKSAHVAITIYNMNGQVVDKLVNQQKEPGFYSVSWDARNVSTGVYFYQIQAGEFSQVKKCLLIK